MVNKICYLIVAFFLLAGWGNSFGAERIKNAPKQGSIVGVANAGDEGKESNEAVLNWYREQFVLWQVCQEELVAKLGENIKRDKAYSRRTIAALEKLSEVLPKEKRQDLGNYISKYRQIAGDLEQVRSNSLKREWVKRTLNDLKKAIEKKFSYNVVEVRTNLIKRNKEIIASGKVSPSSETPPAQTKHYRYVADKNSRVFHRLMCIYVSKISKKDRVYFETKKEARESGRRLHRCHR